MLLMYKNPLNGNSGPHSPGLKEKSKMWKTNTSGFMSTTNAALYSKSFFEIGEKFKKKKTDGTSVYETARALSTYLNTTGPGDYHLPNLTGSPTK
jgi:hypothetical protein